ncbi:hypothetical protein EMIT0P294_130147 [Pseudomonas sp. IT-P294]
MVFFFSKYKRPFWPKMISGESPFSARSSHPILPLSDNELAIAVVGASHARCPIHATRFVLLLKHQTAPNDHWRFNRHNVRLQLFLLVQLWRSHPG